MRVRNIETVTAQIEALRAQETVYKVEVDDMWNDFRHAFENEWRAIKDAEYLSTPHEDRTEVDQSIYFESPFEVRHWYGKKFDKFLGTVPDTLFKQTTVAFRARWEDLFAFYLELKGRQVKGRKPAEPKKVISTRTQLRAICPCCFRQQAVKGNRMVAHGYTLDYGFQNGNCRGVRQPHFGTVAGMQFTQGLINEIRNDAVQATLNAEKASKGVVKPRDRDHKAIENPTAWQVRELVNRFEGAARNATYHADQLQKRIDVWKMEDPVEVEVEITA